ncbi:SIMPL domain-containing protein [Halomonas beimenensis]|uniref:DUF541 domain-containing protein n=1 Tax=Halomonas beimenensis TaxID=475662 RepID=A0A291P4M6_9GAMM|nr:SIMPL domain-containing protein [Halomonas beimenensis]ATJ81874.1 protein of unknown function DUF541 [Halomonas beimenensis]
MTRRTVSPALLTALLLALPLTTLAGQPSTPHRLDVQARAELEVVPDRASLRARLWERTPAVAREDAGRHDSEALAEARGRLEERAAVLIRTLEAAGLERDAIQAGSLQVQPEMLPERRVQGGETRPMMRTRLERPIRVQVAELDRLPSILDALTEAGVDALDGITYDLTDREEASDRALVKALERARHKAELMAETLDVELGAVLSIEEQQAPVFQPRMMAMSADARESGGSAEYRPGTLTIDAAVNVGWAIEQP